MQAQLCKKESGMGEQLIPGLPAEVAILCLTKLPIDAVARNRTVSRSWAHVLGKYILSGRLPHSLAVYCRGKPEVVYSRSWLFLSRSDLRSFVIPFVSKDEQDKWTRNRSSNLEVIATGTPLLLVHAGVRFGDGEEACSQPCGAGIVEGSLLQGFDVWQMKWLSSKETPWSPMPVHRRQFATAYFDKAVYFAGGDGPAAPISAERLSLDTWTWEILPPMHKERSLHPSGFTIGGRFFVVGGESHSGFDELPQSGEIYDPNTNAWMLVPDMWPLELWWAFGEAQKVVVVDDVAYTINQKLQAVVRLTMDDPSIGSMKWQVVGQLPWTDLDDPIGAWMHHLVNVQNELWAVLNNRFDHWVVYACKPHRANQGLQWERLPFVIWHSEQATLTSGLDITV